MRPDDDGGCGTRNLGTEVPSSWLISCGSSDIESPTMRVGGGPETLLSSLAAVGEGWDFGGNCPKSRSPFRSIGDHPAAILPATMPVMTVAAPNAELDLDLIDRDRFLESGVPTEPKLFSRVGVVGNLTEFDRECSRE